MHQNSSSFRVISRIARLMGPTWGPYGVVRTQVGPMLSPWTLLSGMFHMGHGDSPVARPGTHLQPGHLQQLWRYKPVRTYKHCIDLMSLLHISRTYLSSLQYNPDEYLWENDRKYYHYVLTHQNCDTRSTDLHVVIHWRVSRSVIGHFSMQYIYIYICCGFGCVEKITNHVSSDTRLIRLKLALKHAGIHWKHP